MTTQYINSREARQNFSKLIHSVGVSTDSYTINVRNRPKVVLVDIDTANKYLPAKEKNKYEPSGKVFAREALKWLDKMYGKNSKPKPKENLSERVDELVYGI